MVSDLFLKINLNLIIQVMKNEMKKQIEKINKEDVEGYEKLVNFTKKIFDKGFTELQMFHLINHFL